MYLLMLEPYRIKSVVDQSPPKHRSVVHVHQRFSDSEELIYVRRLLCCLMATQPRAGRPAIGESPNRDARDYDILAGL